MNDDIFLWFLVVLETHRSFEKSLFIWSTSLNNTVYMCRRITKKRVWFIVYPDVKKLISIAWQMSKLSLLEIKMVYILCGIMTIYDEIWLLKYVVNERLVQLFSYLIIRLSLVIRFRSKRETARQDIKSLTVWYRDKLTWFWHTNF